jgi:hypothetical protein
MGSRDSEVAAPPPSDARVMGNRLEVALATFAAMSATVIAVTPASASRSWGTDAVPPTRHPNHDRHRHHHEHRYWSDCGSYFEGGTTVIAHKVHCSKARHVISTLYRVSQEAQAGGPIYVDGFQCVDEEFAHRPFVCSHGDHIVKGPVPG